MYEVQESQHLHQLLDSAGCIETPGSWQISLTPFRLGRLQRGKQATEYPELLGSTPNARQSLALKLGV